MRNPDILKGNQALVRARVREIAQAVAIGSVLALTPVLSGFILIDLILGV